MVAEGTLKDIMAVPESLTGQYMSGKRKIEVPKQRVAADPEKVLKLTGARGNNLKDVTLTLPVGLFTCITGVSGSGKSTLINDTLFPIAQTALNGATLAEPAPYRDVQGLEHFDKVIDIDQSPIGRTPRSNPATYTGVFTPVRELFAGVPESRARGYTPGRFSFNVRGGRCEACQGDGVIKVEMHFLPDIYVPCDQCKGKRYNRETLEIKYKGKTIHEVLDMTIEEAREFFDAVPALARKLQTLMDVGLTYIRLGQSATTLSGGEAQRVKLARELSKRGTGQTLYILDEPTTGLHFADIQQLLDVLHQLRDQGNTIVVIEHNLDVIKPLTGLSISVRKAAAAAGKFWFQAHQKRSLSVKPHTRPVSSNHCCNHADGATLIRPTKYACRPDKALAPHCGKQIRTAPVSGVYLPAACLRPADKRRLP